MAGTAGTAIKNKSLVPNVEHANVPQPQPVRTKSRNASWIDAMPQDNDAARRAKAAALRGEGRTIVTAANEILQTAVKAGRNLSDDEYDQVQQHLARVEDLTSRAAAIDNVIEHATLSDDVQALAVAARKSLDARSDWGSSTPLHDIVKVTEASTDERWGGTSATKARSGDQWGAAIMKRCADRHTGLYKGLTPSGAVVTNITAPEPISFGRPVTMLRSIISNEITSGAVSYFRQDVRTFRAAPVAPGALKPESDLEFTDVTDRVRVLAHLSQPIVRQTLDDSTKLLQVVKDELAYGVGRALEDQVLNGTGIGESMTGLAATPGVLTVTAGGIDPMDVLTALRTAKTKLQRGGVSGTAWVMAPETWQDIELLWTADQGLLLNTAGAAVPLEAASQRLWGLPVVVSPDCPANIVWHADFIGSCRIFLREDVRIDWSENVSDDFAKNLIRFRAEMRATFGVLRPSGVVKITL